MQESNEVFAEARRCESKDWDLITERETLQKTPR